MRHAFAAKTININVIVITGKGDSFCSGGDQNVKGTGVTSTKTESHASTSEVQSKSEVCQTRYCHGKWIRHWRRSRAARGLRH